MIPGHYLATIGDLGAVESMLELGNKNGTGGKGDSYKSYFAGDGIRHVSVDLNGEDGALALDLRQPLNLGTFDMVTNIGTSEHVDDQVPVWRNMVDACDHVLVCITPAPGDWPGHGLFYPSCEFYLALAALNGFEIEKLQVEGEPGRRFVHFRAIRIIRDAFIMPALELLIPAPPKAPKRR